MRAALATLLALAAAAMGCGEPPPCGAGGGCPGRTVCQLDGTCLPLASGPGARFARTRRLHATDWGILHEGWRPSRPTALEGDELGLGGPDDGHVHLAFGPLPEDRPLGRAVLALHPHPAWSGPTAAGQLEVRRTRPFDGGTLTSGHTPAAEGRERARRRFEAVAARPLRIEVTELVRAARRDDRSHAHLRVGLSGGGADATWRLASPRASDPDRRPHLDLLLR